MPPHQTQQPRTTGYSAQHPRITPNAPTVSGNSANSVSAGIGGQQPADHPDNVVDYKTTITIILTVYDTISSHFTFTQIVQTLERLQEKVQQQESTISGLLKENSGLQAQKGAKRRGASTVSDIVNEADEDLATVSKLGRWWGLFMSPRIEVSAIYELDPPYKWDDPEIYGSIDKARSFSMAPELIESIPPPLLAKMHEDRELIKQFRKQVGEGRSSLLFKLKASAAILLDLKPVYFSKGPQTVKRSTDPKIRQLLGLRLDKNGKDIYTNKPPILFHNGATGDLGSMFLNPVLIKIAILCVHSPEVLNSNASSHPQSPYVRHKDWKNRVTPGLIAWVCMMLIYILSDDTKFKHTCIGDVTEIDYLRYHLYYKGIITKGLDKLHFQKLLQTWNRQIFPKFATDTDTETINIDDSALEAQEQSDDDLKDIDALLEGLDDLGIQEGVREPLAVVPRRAMDGESDDEEGGSSEDEAEGVHAQVACGFQQRHASDLRPQASQSPDYDDFDKTEESIEPAAIDPMSIHMNSTSAPPVRTYSFYTSTPAASTSQRRFIGARMVEEPQPFDNPENRHSLPSFRRHPPLSTATQPFDPALSPQDQHSSADPSASTGLREQTLANRTAAGGKKRAGKQRNPNPSPSAGELNVDVELHASVSNNTTADAGLAASLQHSIFEQEDGLMYKCKKRYTPTL
ncbi:hypothetical protein CPC08DRAFT_724104 [Agrocybe pediades]|nr:hypothetical protein CPC08DRAFT_724104 [Agrocybe pediades]